MTFTLMTNKSLMISVLEAKGGKGGVNPSLSWIFFGWDHPTDVTAYIDDIEMGDGEGETAGKPQAVSASDKLATTWGKIKQRL